MAQFIVQLRIHLWISVMYTDIHKTSNHVEIQDFAWSVGTLIVFQSVITNNFGMTQREKFYVQEHEEGQQYNKRRR